MSTVALREHWPNMKTTCQNTDYGLIPDMILTVPGTRLRLQQKKPKKNTLQSFGKFEIPLFINTSICTQKLKIQDYLISLCCFVSPTINTSEWRD